MTLAWQTATMTAVATPGEPTLPALHAQGPDVDPQEAVKYLREVIWPMAQCAKYRDPDVEQYGIF
eukprot:11227759-Lingulodinium_polyedra.AAC.1